MSDTYKPSEHDGLKQDGTPDKRMEQTGKHHPFCHPSSMHHISPLAASD